MVNIDITYEGDLHTSAVHGPSGATIQTDAPKDNQGRGEAFSPTDLLATALGTCMLTIMGIVAKRDGIALEGTKVSVGKHMSPPPRKVERLEVTFHVPVRLSAEQKTKLENAAHTCPVHRSLHPDVQVVTQFNWAE
ncbi:MAG: OsmC family protein [Tepidisphaeraceae bacterium]